MTILPFPGFIFGIFEGFLFFLFLSTYRHTATNDAGASASIVRGRKGGWCTDWLFR